MLRRRLAPIYLTALCSVSLVEAISSTTGLSARIKWPNDVMVGDRKVAGVLTELVAHTGWTVVGIGLNVNTDHTTNDLPATATSLAQESARWIARGALLRAILERIDFHLGAITSYGEEHVRARWEALLWRRHQRVQVDDEGKVVEGTVLGLSATGALRLRSANGRLLEIVIGDVWLVP